MDRVSGFIFSYCVAVLVATFVLGIIALIIGELSFPEEFTTLTVYTFAMVGFFILVLSVLPIGIGTLLMSSQGNHPGMIKLGLLGMAVGMIEIGVLVVFDPLQSLQLKLGYISSFGLSGLIAGISLSLIWEAVSAK